MFTLPVVTTRENDVYKLGAESVILLQLTGQLTQRSHQEDQDVPCWLRRGSVLMGDLQGDGLFRCDMQQHQTTTCSGDMIFCI